ncbi:hypothetical protein BDV96DRAFT_681663 [Lophiotrema nucula]|uniref:Uncharacterized protein n=1 Tax=Lophiotrema nucula TaxID=690887 RepID=A0A6A5ZUB4_9PLEO|nr:hypothetical protein BDV96DRAFT_681663 [Lophiotrema nucula]
MAEAEPLPIAVIGIGCRLPGGSTSPDAFWQMLLEGRDAWSDVPEERFRWESFYNSSPEAQGCMNHRGGHFIQQDIKTFDADFFGIPPTEANSIDPQQRLLLETAYEAVEDAGISLKDFRGSNTAVYAATFANDYDRMLSKDPSDLHPYHLVGTGNATFANRISYVFDLSGPSVTIDTGCSGSLVAVHQACQSLRTFEADLAIGCGAVLILCPDHMVAMSPQHILNEDGRCFSFDSRGSGYGRGEGAGLVLLKRLDDAIRDGDQIRAIIRSTASNQDGRTNGIAQPSQISQECLALKAFRNLRFSPEDIQYLEAHATGTSAGDIAEANAVHNVYTHKRVASDLPLIVGSVKSNIGHLEAASGVAGLIKTILCMEKGIIPPNLLFKKPKAGLPLDEWHIKIPLEIEPWPITRGPRRAVVNNFGYGGTNAIVILESASAHTRVFSRPSPISSLAKNCKPDSQWRLLQFSAKSEASLAGHLTDINLWLQRNPTIDLDDIVHAVSLKPHFPWRKAIVTKTTATVGKMLSAAFSAPPKRQRSHTAFVFTGQGAQWPQMGCDLMHYAPFAESIRRSTRILNGLGCTWSLEDELLAGEEASKIHNSNLAQPATTALQIALADLLRFWDVKAAAVIGHSSGEIAAAYSAQMLSHEEALAVAYHRGSLAALAKEKLGMSGAMLAVGLGEIDLHRRIVTLGIEADVTAACINSPSSTTASGTEEGITALEKALTTERVFVRRLKVNTAYHSHHMEAVADDYLSLITSVSSSGGSAATSFYSTVTTQRATSQLSPKYWVENLVSPVLFSDAVSTLVQDFEQAGHLDFLEIGPHSALQGPLRQVLAEGTVSWSYLPTLVRNQDGTRTILGSAAALFEHGSEVKLHVPQEVSRIPIRGFPSYHWDRKYYWHEPRLSSAYRNRIAPPHDLLGLRILTSPDSEPGWRVILDQGSLPWLADHVIDGVATFPATAYLGMVTEALKEWRSGSKNLARNIEFQLVSFTRALQLRESTSRTELVLNFRRGAVGLTGFRICSNIEGKWYDHCCGEVRSSDKSVGTDSGGKNEWRSDQALMGELDKIKSACNESIDPSAFYDILRRQGNDYGPAFSSIREVRVNPTQAFVAIDIPDLSLFASPGSTSRYTFHPAIFDALLQVPVFLFARAQRAHSIMPVSLKQVLLAPNIRVEAGREIVISCTLYNITPRTSTFDIVAYQIDELGRQVPVIQCYGCDLIATGDADAENFKKIKTPAFEMMWGTNPSSITSVDLESCERSTLLDIKLQEHKLNRILDTADHYIQNALQEVRQLNQIPVEGHLLMAYQALGKGVDEAGVPYNKRNVQALSDLGVEGQLIERIGPSLGPILAGKIDALTLLMEDDLLYRAYQDDSTTRCSTYLIQYLKHLTFKEPNMRILEIGAGTGGSTIPLLAALSTGDAPFASSYYFTDISAGFFEQAKASLSRWSDLITMKTLDIEKDPCDQGFEEYSFDLIIASNVLHATRRISNTLGNVHKLLKPGGRLALTELIENNSFYRMTFGLLPGWWSGADDNRIDGPLLSTDRWSKELRQASFADPDIIAFDFPGPARRAAFLVSRARAALVPNGYHTYEAKLLNFLSVDHPGHALVKPLAHHLEGRSYQLIDAPWSSHDVDQASSYIVLDTHDRPFLAKCTPEQFNRVTSLVTNSATIYWLTISGPAVASNNAGSGLVTGFARTARSENESLRFITVDIQDDAAHNLNLISRLVTDIVSAPTNEETAIDVNESEFRIVAAKLQIPRIARNVDMDMIAPKEDTDDSRSQEYNVRHSRLDPEATYVIVGGLGKLGRQLCEHLASLGATSIALLSRRHLNGDERSALEHQMSTGHTSVRVFTCDISNSADIEDVETTLHTEFPAIKGIIQAAMVLEDHSLNDTTLDFFKMATTPKYVGTRNLMQVFKNTDLDFFVMLSSLSGIVGLPGQANYAAGNTFEDQIAHCEPPTRWKRVVSLDLPLLADTNLLSEEEQPRLMRRGMQAISNEVLFPYLDFAMSSRSPNDGIISLPRHQQVVIGLDMQAASEGNQAFYSKNPLFSHVFASQARSHNQPSSVETTITKTAIETLTSGHFDAEDRQMLTVQALREKIASLVAVSYDEIGIETPIVEFGLDSLIAIELKNWITKMLKSPMQTSDILDSTGILALAELILKRTGNQVSTQRSSSMDLVARSQQPHYTPVRIDSVQPPKLLNEVLKLPLRPLEEILDTFYNSVTALGNEDELLSVCRAIHDFKTPGGIGEELQRRLAKLANTPKVDCWLSDIYNQSFWLRRRAPLRPSINFFSTHVIGTQRYTQAEKAALLTLTAFEFKQKLERSQVPQDFVNDEPQCMESLKWIFNIYRRPGVRWDEALQFPGNDYIAVMRNGHVYKIPLLDKGRTISYSRLIATFESIKRTAPNDISWAGLLTAAERTQWAQARELAINACASNEEFFTMLEKSLFIISLDDTSPETSQERAQSFLFDDNRSRWNDKTLSFVVCENGVSAFWCEHSMIDGTTMDQLGQAITRAINGPKPEAAGDVQAVIEGRDFTPYPFVTSPEIDQQIEVVRTEYQDSIKGTDFAVIDLSDFGEDYLRQHRLPPKGVLNAIISLAIRHHFGHSPAFYEAVSMRSFRLGRLEIYQVHTPEMASFVNFTVSEPTSSSSVQQYQLLQDAANTHAAGIANHSRGRGWDRQLTALRCVLEEGEEEPALFSNPLYVNTRPRKVFVSFSNGGQPEWGSVWRDDEALWIGVEIAKDSCKLCISNGEGKANAFGELVREAAGVVKAIIEGARSNAGMRGSS